MLGATTELIDELKRKAESFMCTRSGIMLSLKKMFENKLDPNMTELLSWYQHVLDTVTINNQRGIFDRFIGLLNKAIEDCNYFLSRGYKNKYLKYKHKYLQLKANLKI